MRDAGREFPERAQAGLASELVLRLLQRGLREQAIGDVETGADIAGKSSIRFAARNARIQDPAISPFDRRMRNSMRNGSRASNAVR